MFSHWIFFLLFICQLNGQMKDEFSLLKCVNPLVTVHIYSSQMNPQWLINQTQFQSIEHLSKESLKETNSFNRVMGYQGFSLKCFNAEIFVSENIQLEKELLKTGESYLSKEMINHINKYLGITRSINSFRNLGRINCNHVPIKGPDTVPLYNPLTDNGGCFITKQSLNNCYAYGVDIVTNTYPQPGRSNGKSPPSLTCQSIRNASIRDGLIYKGTNFPNDQPKLGHYVALFIWPNVDYHWVRKDENGFWSHKPGTGRVTNRDNKDAFILNPVKSDLSPWDLFCGYFIAQPSKIHIY